MAVEVAVLVGVGVRLGGWVGTRVPTILGVAVDVAIGVPETVGLGGTGCVFLCVVVGVNVGCRK